MNEREDKVAALEIVFPNLSAKDKVFAGSLIDQAKKRPLSDKQVYWVGVLLERALGKDEKKEPEVVKVGDFSGVYGLFQKAKQKLKFPKIHLLVENVPVVLAMSGSKAKVPNAINVMGEGSFETRAWYGRVMSDGAWVKGLKPQEGAGKVEEVLKALSRNPAKAAKEYGKLTGRCCFCNAQLSDEKSTAAGFGPTCAENFGLKQQWKDAQPVLETPKMHQDLITKVWSEVA